MHWEYRATQVTVIDPVVLDGHTVPRPPDGDDTWELVGIFYRESSQFVKFYWKRPRVT